MATNPGLFDSDLRGKLIGGLGGGKESAKVWTAVIANLARGSSVAKVGGLVAEGRVVGMILSQCEDVEDTEAVEGALFVSLLRSSNSVDWSLIPQTLEVLVLRCPTEITTAVLPIMDKALELVKYDPVSTPW